MDANSIILRINEITNINNRIIFTYKTGYSFTVNKNSNISRI